jgi:hypothetical protein
MKMTEQEVLQELRRRFDEDTANTVYRLNGLLMERDAEIERLKAQVKELSEAYQKAIGPIQPAERREATYGT